MAINITVDYPSVQVLDDTRVTETVTPYGVCLMLGSGTTTTNNKKIIDITSLEDFSTKVGDTSVSKKYVQAFFENRLNTGIALKFYKVNTDATAAVAADFVNAIGAIDATFNPGGIVISPEFFESFTLDADISAMSNALDLFCNTDNDSYWISIVDIPLSILNIADAVTAKNKFSSPKGNLITYQPWYYSDVANTIKMHTSAAMAAICLSVWSGGKYGNVPAGINYPIKGVNSLGYSLSKANLATAHDNGINAIRFFPLYGYVPYDSFTISNAIEYLHINSVVCFKIVVYLLERELLPYVHFPIAGDIELLTQIEGTLSRVLNSCWLSGYLAGNVEADAFEIKPQLETLPPPDNSVLVFECAVRPSYSLQKIVVYLKNKLGQAI